MVSPKFATRHIVLMVVAVAFCLLTLPRTAAADDADVVTLNFTGTVSCGASCTDPITGTYSFDPDTDSIIGPWSFSSALGSFSSTDADPFVGTDTSADQSFAGNFQLLDFASGDMALQLAFNGSNGFDGTMITSASVVPTGTADPSMLANVDTGATFDILSGSTTVVATPEPSSILLLGLGIFGCAILRRKRSLGRLRLVQS